MVVETGDPTHLEPRRWGVLGCFRLKTPTLLWVKATKKKPTKPTTCLFFRCVVAVGFLLVSLQSRQKRVPSKKDATFWGNHFLGEAFEDTFWV